MSVVTVGTQNKNPNEHLIKYDYHMDHYSKGHIGPLVPFCCTFFGLQTTILFASLPDRTGKKERRSTSALNQQESLLKMIQDVRIENIYLFCVRVGIAMRWMPSWGVGDDWAPL